MTMEIDALMSGTRARPLDPCDECASLRALAKDAYEAWDNDRDAKVGKLLRAMLDANFRKQYRPDLAAQL